MTKTDELKSLCLTKGLKYVGTRGNTNGPVCLVGEAPGADEDQSGVPFVGASGRELDRLLGEAGIRNECCWWTNPYKVRPPDNDLDRLPDLGIADQVFIDQFLEELNDHKPTIIVPLGATPLGVLCPFTIEKRTGAAAISKWRGSILQSPLLQWSHYVVPSFHPAYLFRNWTERPIAVLCMSKAGEELQYWLKNKYLQPLPDPKLITDPPYSDTVDYIQQLLQADAPVSLDIENIGVYKGKYKTPQRNRLPYVLGLCNDTNCGMSIDLAGYATGQTEKIWQLLDLVLSQKRTIGQNSFTHDLPWLEYIGFRCNAALHSDNMVLHHVLWPELSHKLEFQTMQYTRWAYYKDEGKSWSVKERQRMKAYNIKDVIVTLEAHNAMLKELASRGQH